MKKELTLRWTKTKPLTRQGRGKEEETASVASLFVLFKFKPLSKNGEYYNKNIELLSLAYIELCKVLNPNLTSTHETETKQNRKG